jgi:MoaA/NifB/PqqE/SkfB family radical SAM enzyme
MDIKNIHVEASTYCNARCPLCPRNLYGYKVEGVYPETHLKVDKFKECLNLFPDRDYVYFNGNLGDPMMNPDIVSLTDLTGCRTSITTNGSIGTEDTWKLLAEKNVEVVFSVDGMEDTNHLYRQDVSWFKVMERMKWFIGAGGKATWKFVVFKHNSHQKSQARDLSEKLGFVDFVIKDHGRNYGPALDREGNITHWILPEDGSKSPKPYDVQAGIERYKSTHYNFNLDKKTYDISCDHLRARSVYIDARGRIAPCCHQGFDLPDLPFVSLNGFADLEKSWKTQSCDPVCARSCAKLK